MAGDNGQLLTAGIFARVKPEEKLELVRAYQAAGEIVAMTGDGVNDAPALRQADIGVAMGLRGTDVARQAAAMILLDDAFPTIVMAVREGRVIFENVRRVAAYLLSCNASEVLVVGLAILAALPLPILPLQILVSQSRHRRVSGLCAGHERRRAGRAEAPAARSEGADPRSHAMDHDRSPQSRAGRRDLRSAGACTVLAATGRKIGGDGRPF